MPIQIRKKILYMLSKEILYLPHGTKMKTIADHVRIQLNERIKTLKRPVKDFFFLTAFLDTSTNDEAIHVFRSDNYPYLKRTLINIVKNNEKEIDNILNAYPKWHFNEKSAYENFLISNKKDFCRLLKNKKFKKLYAAVPGRLWLKGLLLLFMVLKKVYGKNKEKAINKILENDDYHKTLKEIHGVGPKLALWSITNVDGSRFVIDVQIAKTLKKIGLPGFGGSTKTYSFRKVDETWTGLFGKKNKSNEWNKFNRNNFKKLFSQYSFKDVDYQYLKFIITQTFWFYGRDRCLTIDVLPK